MSRDLALRPRCRRPVSKFVVMGALVSVHVFPREYSAFLHPGGQGTDLESQEFVRFGLPDSLRDVRRVLAVESDVNRGVSAVRCLVKEPQHELPHRRQFSCIVRGIPRTKP